MDDKAPPYMTAKEFFGIKAHVCLACGCDERTEDAFKAEIADLTAKLAESERTRNDAQQRASDEVELRRRVEQQLDARSLLLDRIADVVCYHRSKRNPLPPLDQFIQTLLAHTYDTLIADMRKWQKETFPHATPASVAAHLVREAYELSAHPNDPHEIADIFHLVVSAAHVNGLDLYKIVLDKYAMNRARKWGPPDADGVSEHVP